MSKLMGVVVALAIVKGGEVIVLYQAMPVLRRLWGRLLAADRSVYSIEMRTSSRDLFRYGLVSAIRNVLRAVWKRMEDLGISHRAKTEDH